MAQGRYPNENFLSFSSLQNTNDAIQPQMLVPVAGHAAFDAFIKSTLLRRPQAPPFHSAPPR